MFFCFLKQLACEGSHILFMTPFTAPSHSSFFKPVIWELAKRGHTITYWSGLRPPLPTKNINGTDEIEQRIRHLFSKSLSERFNFDQHGIDWNVVDHPFKLLFTLSDRLAQTCTAMYQDPIFNMIRNSTGNEFDLIVVDAVSFEIFKLSIIWIWKICDKLFPPFLNFL